MESQTDTIAAVATAPGRGGIGVVRISGPKAAAIGGKMLRLKPSPRVATHASFCGAHGAPIDTGIALWFPSPRSFTGEDVLELQGHGGPVVLDLVLAETLRLGARLATPGEFSLRAYLNGKMDLASAEAVADLIDASTEAAVRGAMRTLHGAFSKRIYDVVDALLRLRTLVEGSLDFPEEEDVGGVRQSDLEQSVAALLEQLAALRRDAGQANLLREGASVAILGPPNVGKSSLLNRLVGKDSAFVTDVRGTTRDTVRESLNVGGIPLHLIDTAGLRDTADPVERVGIERAREAAVHADLVLYVVDSTSGTTKVPVGMDPLVVRNKIDLSGEPAGKLTDGVNVSALTGAGIDYLRDAMLKSLGVSTTLEGTFSARRRHLDALDRAAKSLLDAQAAVSAGEGGLEFVAEDLRLAHRALGEITGEFTTEDMLGEIFSTFCIGK